jgi:hypothetical protein
MLARQVLYHLSQPCFVLDSFKIGSTELFAQGCLPTVILMIFASGVARITGVSRWHPAEEHFFFFFFFF